MKLNAAQESAIICISGHGFIPDSNAGAYRVSRGTLKELRALSLVALQRGGRNRARGWRLTDQGAQCAQKVKKAKQAREDLMRSSSFVENEAADSAA